MGASFALTLVAEGLLRPACLLLFHGTGPAPEPGTVASARLTLSIEAHLAVPDAFEPDDLVRTWRSDMLELGAALTVFHYPGAGHLFTDPGVPDFSRPDAEIAWARGLQFLARNAQWRDRSPLV
jgi:dienelactone hydrolase